MTSGWQASTRVPGSGQLDERHRVLTAHIHRVIQITAGTMMAKVLAPQSVPRYLRGEVSAGRWGQAPPFDAHVIAGMVVRLEDTARLRTPRDWFQAFRLDFPGSPFRPDAPVVHVLEFAALRPGEYLVPFGAPSVPDPAAGLPPNSPEVRETAYAMVQAAEQAGVDPNTYRKEIAPWPYSGTGLTDAGELALAEWGKQPGPVPAGALIVAHGPAGRQPVAVYRGRMAGWQEAR